MSALAGAALLTACSADTTDPDFDGLGSEVLVRATIGSTVTRTSPAAADNTAWTDGDKMSINDGKNTVVYTYDSSTGKWSPAAGEFLKWEYKSGTIKASMPANGRNRYGKGVIMQDQSTSANLAASDYMTGSYAYESIPSDRTLTLQMERQTALVVIDKDIEYDNEFEGTNPTITDLSVMSSLCVPTDNDLKAISTYKDADGYRYAIVSPTASKADETFIQLTVKAGTTSKTLTIKGIPELTAGKRYSYKLHVGKEVATIGSVKVTEWVNGSSLTDKAVYKCTINGNTITLTTAGVLAETPSLIEQAIGSGNSLAVKGTISENDIFAINEYISTANDKINLDLSGTTLTVIPYGAFENNLQLGEVTLPTTLTTICEKAFEGCESASFPNFDAIAPNLETIGSDAFNRAKEFEGSYSFDALKSIGYSAFADTRLQQAIFPSTITDIPDQLFCDCMNIHYVTFLGDVKSIGGDVFSSTVQLQTIDLSNCESVPTCSEDAFSHMYTTTQIKVKSSLLSAFQSADVWKDIASHIVGN